MSIPQGIRELEKAGELIEYRPAHTDPDFRHSRHIFMTKDAWTECPPSGNSNAFTGKALANMRTMLETIIGGEEVWEEDDFKLLIPEKNNVWEIRVTMDPYVRMFGWFAAPDVFIISHCVLRKLLANERVEWNKAIRRCMRRYNGHLKMAPPYVGKSFTDYITHNGVAK